MKIAYFVDTYLPQVTGISYALQSSVKELISRGHEVKILSPSPESDSPGEEFSAPSFSVPFRTQKLGIASPSCVGDVDLIHVHQPYTIGGAGLYKAIKNDIPMVYTFHTDHYSIIRKNIPSRFLSGTLSSIFEKWEEFFLKKADGIVSPTELIREKYLSGFGDKVEVIPNPIDIQLFREVEGNFADLSDLEDKVVGYAGRISREKNLEILIELADLFEGKIYIVGEGEAEKYYKELAKGKNNLKFYDFVAREDLPSFFSSIDFFINPSVSETQGMTVLEANSCGTPVLGARKMALKEVIEEGKNGLLFDPHSPEDLEEKLRKGYDMRKDLSEGSKEVAKRYSPEKLTGKLVELYRNLV